MKAAGDGDDREWDGWMASWTLWNEFWKMVKYREAWHAAVYGVSKSQV